MPRVDVRPVHPAVDELNQLAAKLGEARLFESAVVVAKRVIQIHPESAELWANLAAHLWSLRNYSEAHDCCRRALILNPNCLIAWGNLGLALECMGRTKEAIIAFDKALQIDPEHFRTRFDRGLLYLEEGDYEKGWEDYESRIPTSGRKIYPKYAAPIWQGEDISDKTIFLMAEQGIGDSILFSRYIPWLSRKAKKVYACYPALTMPLIWAYRDYVEFVPEAVPVPETDYMIWAGQLPRLHGTRINDILPDPGFIARLIEHKLKIAPMLVPQPENLPFRPWRIGICWSGNPRQDRNRDRAIPLEIMFQLAEHPKVFLYSLQCGPAANDIYAIGAQDFIIDNNETLVRLGLSATGTAMLQLDLVVTCDTSIAHLAGALGLESWVLQPEDCYWVWGRNKSEHSPWWPSLRLFRQESPGSWQPVMDRVKTELKALIAKGGRVPLSERGEN